MTSPNWSSRSSPASDKDMIAVAIAYCGKVVVCGEIRSSSESGTIATPEYSTLFSSDRMCSP
jgi:hypothetical protein